MSPGRVHPAQAVPHPPSRTWVQAVAGQGRGRGPQAVRQLESDQHFCQLGQRVGTVGAEAALLKDQAGSWHRRGAGRVGGVPGSAGRQAGKPTSCMALHQRPAELARHLALRRALGQSSSPSPPAAGWPSRW